MEAIYDIAGVSRKETQQQKLDEHQMWAAQFYKYDKPRKLLTSGVVLEQWDTVLEPVLEPKLVIQIRS